MDASHSDAFLHQRHRHSAPLQALGYSRDLLLWSRSTVSAKCITFSCTFVYLRWNCQTWVKVLARPSAHVRASGLFNTIRNKNLYVSYKCIRSSLWSLNCFWLSLRARRRERWSMKLAYHPAHTITHGHGWHFYYESECGIPPPPLLCDTSYYDPLPTLLVVDCMQWLLHLGIFTIL